MFRQEGGIRENICTGYKSRETAQPQAADPATRSENGQSSSQHPKHQRAGLWRLEPWWGLGCTSGMVLNSCCPHPPQLLVFTPGCGRGKFKNNAAGHQSQDTQSGVERSHLKNHPKRARASGAPAPSQGMGCRETPADITLDNRDA